MAEELIGQKVKIWECGPLELPNLQRDDETALLDPQVGEVRELRCFAVSADGTVIGVCSIYNPTVTDVELGVWITKDYRDKGYGSEVAKVLSDYYLSMLGFARVHLKVIPVNGRAIRSYEKAGFERCGKIVVDGIEFVKMERRR